MGRDDNRLHLKNIHPLPGTVLSVYFILSSQQICGDNILSPIIEDNNYPQFINDENEIIKLSSSSRSHKYYIIRLDLKSLSDCRYWIFNQSCLCLEYMMREKMVLNLPVEIKFFSKPFSNDEEPKGCNR